MKQKTFAKATKPHLTQGGDYQKQKPNLAYHKKPNFNIFTYVESPFEEQKRPIESEVEQLDEFDSAHREMRKEFD